MKKIIFLLLFSLPLMAFSQDGKVNEYLTMTQLGTEIKISYSDGHAEVAKVREEMKSKSYDFTPFLTRLVKFEAEGWVIVTNNMFAHSQGNVPRNYVLMRRTKG